MSTEKTIQSIMGLVDAHKNAQAKRDYVNLKKTRNAVEQAVRNAIQCTACPVKTEGYKPQGEMMDIHEIKQADTQPKALRFADKLSDMCSQFETASHERGIVNGAIQELRRLRAESELHQQELASYRFTVENRDARIAELEAQLVKEAARTAEQNLRAWAIHVGGEAATTTKDVVAQAWRNAGLDVIELAAVQHGAQPVAWLAEYVDREGNSAWYVSTHKELAVENDRHGTPRPLYTQPTTQGLDAYTQHNADIGAAVMRACKDLPEGAEIQIYLERGAGTVHMTDWDGNEFDHFSEDHEDFACQINAATDGAISAKQVAAQAKQGGA